MDAPNLLDSLVAFIWENNVTLVMLGLQDCICATPGGSTTLEMKLWWLEVCFPLQMQRGQSSNAINTSDNPFSRPFVHGVMFRTLKSFKVQCHISRCGACFRISVVPFLRDKLGIDALCKVPPQGRLKVVHFAPMS